MRAFYLISVFLHVIAAMTWIGGMVILVVAVMPLLRQSQHKGIRRVFLPEFGRRFGRVSWVCLAILAPTGVINLWMRGVRPGDFFSPEWRSTGFGQLVLAKLSLVLLAVLFSALHQRAAASRHARWFGRSLLVIGVTIVAVAVLLVRAM